MDFDALEEAEELEDVPDRHQESYIQCTSMYINVHDIDIVMRTVSGCYPDVHKALSVGWNDVMP